MKSNSIFKIIYKIHKCSFQRKLQVYVFMSIFITMIILSSLNYIISSNIIRNEVKQHTKDQLIKSSQYVSEYILRLKNMTNVLSDNEVIRAFINGSEDTSQIHKIFDVIKNSDSNLDTIIIVTKDGRVLSNKAFFQMKTSTNMMQEAWYIQAIKNENMPTVSIAGSYDDEGYEYSKRVMSISREIVDDNNENLAVIRMDINFSRIDSYLNKLDLGEEGDAYIIDDKGNIICHPDDDNENALCIHKDLIDELKNKDGFIYDKNVYVEKTSISNSDWQIIAFNSLERLNRYRESLLKWSILIFFVISFLSFITMTLLLRYWFKPLKKLQSTMLDIEKGDLTRRVDEEGSREFQDLSRNFNLMISHINNLLKILNKQQDEMRKYELQALASQINPHFLYNTLDTVIWMAEFNDNRSVVDIIKSLAKFFRLSLNSGNDIILLKDEIDHIRQYLYIQKKRYADELLYTIIEDSNFDEFKLPKLVLQPIVENAIYHGIKGLNREGHIIIKTFKEDDKLVISIYDNGRGMNTNMQEKNKARRLGGVGLSNVSNRLKLYFGDKFNIKVDSSIGEFTDIRLYFDIDSINK